MASIPTYVLNDGTTIPAIGFGTYPLRGDAGRDAVISALEVGYRLVDTAVNYRNERARGGLPADRHGRELRERDRGRRGDPPLRHP
jgi:2,5-diketo-D-gluconate reductase A